MHFNAIYKFRHFLFNLIVESIPPICFPATFLVANESVLLYIWFARLRPLCHADFSCHILVCARLRRCLYLKILNICNITSIIINHFTSYKYIIMGSSFNLGNTSTLNRHSITGLSFITPGSMSQLDYEIY